MTGWRIAPWSFGIVALLLAAAGIAAARLPSRCGEIGRPNVDSAAKVAVAIAVIAWLPGVVAWFRAKHPGWIRGALAIVAVGEVVAWIAVVIYYRHQTAWYDYCG